MIQHFLNLVLLLVPCPICLRFLFFALRAFQAACVKVVNQCAANIVSLELTWQMPFTGSRRYSRIVWLCIVAMGLVLLALRLHFLDL